MSVLGRASPGQPDPEWLGTCVYGRVSPWPPVDSVPERPLHRRDRPLQILDRQPATAPAPAGAPRTPPRSASSVRHAPTAASTHVLQPASTSEGPSHFPSSGASVASRVWQSDQRGKTLTD